MKIGLEIHIPLNTATKLFSDEANGQRSAYAAGEPGTRPVLQKKALRLATRLALTLNMDISETAVFDRKQYFYPDLPKGYQITQHRVPLASNGSWTTKHGDVKIKELHVEEDPSSTENTRTGILVNDERSAEPLIELVTEPCFKTPEATTTFLEDLKTQCEYLGVIAPHKAFKADINISIPETQYTRVEIKNVTGKENTEHAIKYEAWRQRSATETGYEVTRETRHYDDEKRMTMTSRAKETYQEYAFIPEPDIPPVSMQRITENEKAALPKPRHEIIEELVTSGISKQEATTIATHPHKRKYYAETTEILGPSTAQTVITQHLPHILKHHEKTWKDIPPPYKDTLRVAKQYSLPDNTVKDILWQTLFDEETPEAWVKKRVAKKTPQETMQELIEAHPSRVEAYRDGATHVANAFMGNMVRAHPAEDKQKLLETIREQLERL